MEVVPTLPLPPHSIIHERSLETLAPSGGSGDVRHDTITTAQGLQIYGAQPPPEESKASPTKRAAEGLGGMFGVPLEVKYQDLRQFEKLAKKNFSGNKYPTISPRELPPGDDLEEP